uniref:ATP synthase subunit a n=1 Tax=Tetrodontophora bielanensis TaxID=48717 RepID=Q9B513_TETBI|nr:ATP synthase F0 subunit 6 [Tetrodontophora bielanensis]AAK30944.1 ATPase 6 [Tetrodontophora bielanensis]
MMTNLFSIFDPASSIQSSSNWSSTIIIMLMMTPMFWLIPSRQFYFISLIINKIFYEIKTLLGPISAPGSAIMFIALLMMIMFNNFMGLFPYIFTSTSHLVCSMTLSLPLWLSFMVYGWFNFYNHMLAHLVPQSTPSVLMSFMVIIETVSNIIRPLTLAVRLSANMIAGHLLMTLLGNQTASAHLFTLYLLLGTQIILLVLESAVALIQSYVFAVLSSLYSSESSF